jgi:hypothetical protein
MERFLIRSEQKMVCRRRWRNQAMMLVMGAMVGLWAAGAEAQLPTGRAALPTAADFEMAEAKDMPVMRDIVTRSAPSGAKDRATWGAKVASDFSASDLGVNSKRSEVRLNSAILINDLDTIATDRFLVQMLGNDDVAVRYWAARGLSNISKPLVQAGGLTLERVVNALAAQAKVEKSGIVEQEIVKTLIQYGKFVPLLEALNAIGSQMEKSVPDAAVLQTVSLGLDSVSKTIDDAVADDKVKAATVAARLASFATQQLMSNEKSIQAVDPQAKVPADYFAAVQRVVEGATKVAGGAIRAAYAVPKGRSAEELMMNVNGLFGTPGGKNGKLQADMPRVPVPPMIQAGA